MRKKAVWLSAMIITIASCSKPNDPPDKAPLTGSWVLKAAFQNTQWIPAGGDSIKFTIHADSSYTATEPFLGMHFQGNIKTWNDTTWLLQLNKPGFVPCYFRKEDDSTLSIWGRCKPVQCGWRFKKVS
jgi:hypothetical protein